MCLYITLYIYISQNKHNLHMSSVSLTLSLLLTFAPLVIKYVTTSILPYLQETIRAQFPWLFLLLTFAPFVIKNFTNSRLPFKEAQIRAQYPSALLTADTSAPASIKSFSSTIKLS
eukprot:GHVR01108663.1.p1 GENE.GHVR01108663.1~~GHVR01108663.1.p1  ORF type:complete len:116 (+),score=4.93 GHVR01108663.1:106-453(+)